MDSQLKGYKEVVSEWAEAGQRRTTPVKTLVSFDDEHATYGMAPPPAFRRN